MDAVEIYIHIPFCVKKCGYCDFLSFPAGVDVQRSYVDALLRQIRQYGEKRGQRLPVSTVFIGGGTPSVPEPELLGGILEAVREAFDVRADAEISMESNPGTLTAEKLTAYRNFGINRLSIGCQSMDDAELKRLGRIHTREDFLDSFRMAREAGFDNINIDLMSALPGQTAESWERGLALACSLKPEHISAYSLIIEEGTPFFDRYREQEEILARGMDFSGGGQEIPEGEQLPDEETERRMYRRTEEILSVSGYHRYEISNYSLEGRECRHNLGYWTLVPYLGFGLGASSYEEKTGDGEAYVRYRNTSDLKKYLAGDFAPRDLEYLTLRDRQAEFMILGLRLTRGVSLQEFQERFGVRLSDVYGDKIRRYTGQGLLEIRDGRLFLTADGISVSNVVMADFMPDVD